MKSLISHARSGCHLRPSAVLAIVFAASQTACNDKVVYQGSPTLGLSTTSFAGDTIPNKYSSCEGQPDVSPELSWNAPPERTESFALIVTDKDSPLGWNFVHWVLYDVPAKQRELPEAIVKQEQLPDGSRQGRNGFDKIGYVGPCPPGHSPHHYVFDLYAIDTRLNLPAGTSKREVVKALNGHVLASGELVGRYQH